MFDWIAGLAAWELLALEPPGWGGVLLKGLAVSLQVAVGGYLLGFLIGVGGATGKLYGGPILRDLLDVYTTLVRAVPELVLILLLYYAGTDALNQIMILFGAERVDISGLAAGIFVIGVVQGAYGAAWRDRSRARLWHVAAAGPAPHHASRYVAPCRARSFQSLVDRHQGHGSAGRRRCG